MFRFSLLITALITTSLTVQAAWLVKQTVKNGQISVESVEFIEHPTQDIFQKRSVLEFIAEGNDHHSHAHAESAQYQEWIYPDSQLPEELVAHTLKQDFSTVEWPGSEVRTLIQQGSVSNRIDLTMVGDGYTADEKERFFADAQRLTDDLFTEVTFSSYLPLFNVHAVFVPSSESGVSDLKRKNTALGLYRSPRGSKRGVMPGNRSAIEKALRLAPAADYPILIANDDYYGGLGGRYAITTRSPESGAMVLRHELGHNFGEVGEEYDGGSVYSGANASRSQLKWAHWIEGETRKFENKELAGHYSWQNLHSQPFSTNFTFPSSTGADMLFDVKVSSVGWETPQDVRFILNGEELELNGHFTYDRSFFRLKSTPKLAAGTHSLKILNGSVDKNNVLAFARPFAYPADIITDDKFVGGYATFDRRGNKSYRPTFEGCLMRDMRKKFFCAVDQENMWIKLMGPLSIIDGLSSTADKGLPGVELNTLALDNLDIRWYQVINGQKREIEAFRGQKHFALNTKPVGSYRVEVEFKTPEVRKPGVRFFDAKNFEL